MAIVKVAFPFKWADVDSTPILCLHEGRLFPQRDTRNFCHLKGERHLSRTRRACFNLVGEDFTLTLALSHWEREHFALRTGSDKIETGSDKTIDFALNGRCDYNLKLN